jgi:hypothetical protein
MHPEEERERDPTVPDGPREEKEFHPWKLLGWLLAVIAVLAVVAAIVDVIVLGW